jgi:Flp pilus assembly protein TadG
MLGGLFGKEKQGGAALVEMAIAAPLLILLVFGILEFGIAFRDRLTVSNGTQSAGRVTAALGNHDDADIATLQAVEQSLGLLPGAGGGVIKHVQIWKSNGSGEPATACSAAGAGGPNCNWYR